MALINQVASPGDPPLSQWACGPQIVMKIGASFAPQYEVAHPAEVVGAVGRLKPVRCLTRSSRQPDRIGGWIFDRAPFRALTSA